MLALHLLWSLLSVSISKVETMTYGSNVMMALVIALVILVSDQFVATSAQEEEMVNVTRSGDGDTVLVASPEGSCRDERCARRFATYLVEDRMCENDTTLQRNCTIQLVPALPNTFQTDSIAVFIVGNGTLMVLDSTTNMYGVGRMYNRQGERQGPGGGQCRVRRLEVIQGRNLAAQINHTGFSIRTTHIGITIQVTANSLAYARTDYDGEVFRMSVECDRNNQVDCVFFKLNGSTDLTREKFGVPIQSLNTSNYCHISSTRLPPATSSTPTHEGTPSPVITMNTTTDSGSRGPTVLTYIWVGAGVGIGIAGIFLIIACIALGYVSIKKFKQSRNHKLNVHDDIPSMNSSWGSKEFI